MSSRDTEGRSGRYRGARRIAGSTGHAVAALNIPSALADSASRLSLLMGHV